MMSRCQSCGYHWQDEDEDFPTCHFESMGPWDPAPCEFEDDSDLDKY